MADLKAHLKAFEKTFKAEHGREPTKHDIKARPDVADMYKAYSRVKVLSTSAGNGKSKAPTANGVTRNAALFTTPKKPSKPAVEETSEMQVEDTRVGYESANSPLKLRALISKAAFSPSSRSRTTKSPLKKLAHFDALQESPRSKARRWLGGTTGSVEAMPAAMEASPVKAGPSGSAFEPLFDEAPARNIFSAKEDTRPRASVEPPEHVGMKRSNARASNAMRPAKRRKADNELPPREHSAVSDAALMEDVTGEAYRDTLPRLFDASSDDDGLLHHKPRAAAVESDSETSEAASKAKTYRQVTTSPVDASAVIVNDFDGRHAELVRMLDLNTSPTRKHRLAFRNQKESLFAQVLQEPRARAEARLGHATGLEELARLNEDGFGGSDAEAEEEGSDDDWASECEGWKALDGEEMQSFSLFSAGTVAEPPVVDDDALSSHNLQ